MAFVLSNPVLLPDSLAPNIYYIPQTYCLCVLSFKSETRNAGGKTNDFGSADMKFPWLQKRFHLYWQILGARISRDGDRGVGGSPEYIFFNYSSPLL